MAKLDSFTTQIVQYVRSMSDEALLDLVRAHLGGSSVVELPRSTVTKAARTVSASVTVAPISKPKKKGNKRSRATAAQREQLLDGVEKVVTKSKGLSASEIAKKVNVPQDCVSAALRELKDSKRIFQGGERRFARYAGDAKTAAQASVRARTTASGPKRD